MSGRTDTGTQREPLWILATVRLMPAHLRRVAEAPPYRFQPCPPTLLCSSGRLLGAVVDPGPIPERVAPGRRIAARLSGTEIGARISYLT